MYFALVEIDNNEVGNTITYSIIDKFENCKIGSEELALDSTGWLDLDKMDKARELVEKDPCCTENNPFVHVPWYRDFFSEMDIDLFNQMLEKIAKAGQHLQAECVELALYKAIDINKIDKNRKFFVFECDK